MPLGHIVDQMRKFRTAESTISEKKMGDIFYCASGTAGWRRRPSGHQRPPGRAYAPGGGALWLAGAAASAARQQPGRKKWQTTFFFYPNDKALQTFGSAALSAVSTASRAR